MKDFVFKLIDQFTEGVDTYHNNGSMWLIFTDRKKWVIELTEDGTLWYNFHFFKDCFKYLSLDVVENQNYITEWVEDTIQNGVIHTAVIRGVQTPNVEDTIQNGVKHTEPGGYLGSIEMKGKIVHQLESPKQNEEVEDVIENGVINTCACATPLRIFVEDTIQNGVKETKPEYLEGDLAMEEVIQNGIKETIDQWNQNRPSVKDVVEKGVKLTYLGGKDRKIGEIKDIVENGVKLTNSSLQIDGSCVVEDVIQNGIKETWGYEKQPQQRVNQVINQVVEKLIM
jgi:predicted peroxiredoxin